MRVALIAPVTHRIPPMGYGPWEKVAGGLAMGLTERGHQVTLFAPTGTESPAEVVATIPQPLDEWPSDTSPDHRVWEEIHIAEAARAIADGRFDIVHSHLSVHPLGYAPFLPVPLLTTLHGIAWNAAVHPALLRCRHLPFVSLSASERRFLPQLNYVATVNNGIDCEEFQEGRGDGGYVLFAGRMAPEKAPHLAIEAAVAAGVPIKLAGMVEEIHRDYYESMVATAIDGKRVDHLGEVDGAGMSKLYGEATAVLMPATWDEPFGLVVVESLASGTPVIAWDRGALPELIRDGVTGSIVSDVDEAAAALADVARFDRAECRRDAEQRFSLAAMADGYLAAYQTALRASPVSPSRRSAPTPRH